MDDLLPDGLADGRSLREAFVAEGEPVRPRHEIIYDYKPMDIIRIIRSVGNLYLKSECSLVVRYS